MFNKEIRNLKVFLWSRRKNLNYGASKYIQPLILFSKSKSRHNQFVEERFFSKSNIFFIQFIESVLIIIYRSIFHLIDYCFNISTLKTRFIYQFPFIPILTPFIKKKSFILIIHHLDFGTKSLKSNICEYYGSLALKFYPKDIKIVVVSEVWKNFMIKKGFKNSTIIRNSFPKELSEKIILKFKSKEIFDYSGIKTIYLGGASSSKGWLDSAPIVRKYFKDAYIWISSENNFEFNDKERYFLNRYKIKLKVLTSYSDYLHNLSISQCSIFNSNFKEGWNRTLVEAAVISKGIVFSKEIGGMIDVSKIFSYIKTFKNKEELNMKLKSLSQKNEVDKLNIILKNNIKRSKLINQEFLRNFSEEKFINNWLDLLS